MRFMIDESVDARIAAAVVAAGHDVIEVRLNFAGAADVDVAAIALANDRIVITADRDFGDLAFRDKQPMPGIILVRMPGLSYQERSERVLSAIATFSDRIALSIVVVEARKFRIRPLLRLV